MPSRPIALISPHAGYVYSGHVAGYAYKQVVGEEYDTVIIVGISHRIPFSGYAIWRSGSFETPLGELEIDDQLASELMERNSQIRHVPEAHIYEHSIEVQLPFLQVALPEFKFVPILLREHSELYCASLAASLSACLRDRNVLLIASTDLSHYPTYDEAVKADRVVIEAVSTLDSEILRDKIKSYMSRSVPELHTMMCAEGAVHVVMATAKSLGASNVSVLKYANSGDVEFGSKDQVVGYMAAAIW